MSKEEFVKIQTCVLKVNIHCDGCKQKVKKILQKIEGVYTTNIDSEQGKVTVSGNIDPAVLIKKLAKSGKHAELWGPPKGNNNSNQNQLNHQFKNMQLDNGKCGNNNNKGGQKGNNHNNNNNQNNQPKGGQPTPQQMQQLQQLQLQQLQQMKGLQDMKLPQFKGMMMPPFNQNNNQKAVKFAEEEDYSDEDYDDLDDDYDLDDDDEYDDEFDDPQHPLNKKAMMGNGPKGQPNMMMMNGNHPQLMNAQKGSQNGAVNAGGNGKKGGGGGGGGGNVVPVQVLTAGGNEGKNGNGVKKGSVGGGGGNNNGGNQNQGGAGKNGGGKNGGGLPQELKNGNNGGGGGANKNGGNNGGANGGEKGNNGAPHGINDVFPRTGGPNGGNMGHQLANTNMAMGQMGSFPINQMGQMGNISAVQGLPAAAMNGGGAGGGYFQGAGPDVMPGNPYHQQQYLAAVMNQQRAMGGNERIQPMMYARPPPVNYMPPFPYPYPYPPPPQPDPYTHFFSDENTSSCNVM